MSTLTTCTNVEDGNIVDVGGSSVRGWTTYCHGGMGNASMPLVLGQANQFWKQD